MPDMLQAGASFLADQLSEHASQTVTYRRGGQTIVGLAATKCPIRSESDGQVNEDFEPCDWIVKAALLVISSVTVEPQPVTDVIEEEDGQQWEVLDLPNEPCFRPLDPFRTMFRIHTKRIKEAD
jgi:hypothetical protein